jgi:hypothetical protein
LFGVHIEKTPQDAIMPPIQYWFTGGALAAFVGLLATVSTLGFAWYRAAITEQDSTSGRAETAARQLKTERVKGMLGEALVSGEELIKTLGGKNEDQAKSDASAWASKANDLIVAAYGEGEATLFRSDIGYIFYSDGSKNSQVLNWIEGRMRRLSELLQRTDALPLLAGFDPTKFEPAAQ